MKVIVSKKEETYSIYIPKNDLEAKVAKIDPSQAFGGEWELENGMKLYIEPEAAEPKLPKTIRAKKL